MKEVPPSSDDISRVVVLLKETLELNDVGYSVATHALTILLGGHLALLESEEQIIEVCGDLVVYVRELKMKNKSPKKGDQP